MVESVVRVRTDAADRAHAVLPKYTPDFYYINDDCKVRPGGRVQQVLHARPSRRVSPTRTREREKESFHYMRTRNSIYG